jgi:type II secretory pathway component PulL
MYAFSFLKNVVVLSKSEALQKWLAPCSTHVHRVARTVDVCILEQESHMQTKMIMRNGVLRAQNMETFGHSVCMFT